MLFWKWDLIPLVILLHLFIHNAFPLCSPLAPKKFIRSWLAKRREWRLLICRYFIKFLKVLEVQNSFSWAFVYLKDWGLEVGGDGGVPFSFALYSYFLQGHLLWSMEISFSLNQLVLTSFSLCHLYYISRNDFPLCIKIVEFVVFGTEIVTNKDSNFS